jgi:hypothetical protein
LEFLQFLGTTAPTLAPSLLISWVLIRVVLEFLKERREQQEGFRVERKEWRESYEKALAETREARWTDIKNYQTTLVEITALGRDMVNQMHALKGEITKFMLKGGRREAGGNE